MIHNLWLGDSIKKAIDARRIHHQFSPNILEYEYGMLKVSIILIFLKSEKISKGNRHFCHVEIFIGKCLYEDKTYLHFGVLSK